MLWLTMSRFKIYVATFIIASSLLLISPVFGAVVRWEKYMSENNVQHVFYGANWWGGQTFTTYGTNHNISSVKLCIRREGNPSGNFTVGIRTTSNELPTGQDLSNCTILCSNVSTSKEIVGFSLSPEIQLTNNTLYAIVFRNPSGSNFTNRIATYGRNNGIKSGTPYLGGYTVQSTDAGSTWSKVNYLFDHWFEVWGAGNSSIQIDGFLTTVLINNTESNVILGATFDETDVSRILEFQTANNFYIDVGIYGNPINVYVDGQGKNWTYNATLQRVYLTTTLRSGSYLHSNIEIRFWSPEEEGVGASPSPYPSGRRGDEIEISLPIVPTFRINRFGLIVIFGGVGIFMFSALLKGKPTGRTKPRGIQPRRRPPPRVPSPPKRRVKTPRKPKRDKRTGRFIKT